MPYTCMKLNEAFGTWESEAEGMAMQEGKGIAAVEGA